MAAPRRNHEELRTPQSLAATVAQAVTTAGSKGVHNESSLSLRTDEAGGVAERGSNKNSQSHPGRFVPSYSIYSDADVKLPGLAASKILTVF